MSLTTPDNIRTLQRKLYVKAKAEPDFRFYLLYDKIFRSDILIHAWSLAKANGGAPGVDRRRVGGARTTRLAHSALMPNSLTRGHHFSASVFCTVASASGVRLS